ncbi:MAG: glycoside hydrolase family 28 protein [Pirellulales bacterium]|nr:glycoside hydrolase family 28 protein [Pirellulales bacterium]
MRISAIARSAYLAKFVACLSLSLQGVPAVATAPPGAYCVTDFGAVGDGATLNTAALQKAIDTCAAKGGGTVFFPPGTYLTGTLFLRDRVTWHLDAGAVLLGSTDLADYPPQTPAFRSYTDVNYVDKSLLYGENVHDVAIVGHGAIDGQGSHEVFKNKPFKRRPYLIRMIECRNVSVKDVTLRNSAMWVQHYLACDNVAIDGVTIDSLANGNNDGIDIDSCDRVRVANCDIRSIDDCIVLKSTSPRPCRRVTVTNCTLHSRCNALKCGTESTGGFEDITINNCVIHDTRLSGIALETVDGGTLQRVVVSNVTMNNVGNAIFIRLGNRARPYLQDEAKRRADESSKEPAPARPGVGRLRGVIISNVIARGADQIGCAIAGVPGHPVEDVTLENIRITFAGGGERDLIDRHVPEQERQYPEYKMFGPLPAYGFYCRHARNVRFDNVRLDYEHPEHRPALVCDDVRGLQLDAFHAKPPIAGNVIRLLGGSSDKEL